jgi:outer membrane protein assembly factor BamB
MGVYLARGMEPDQSPIVADGLVFVGGGDGGIHAYDATNGAWVWDYFTDEVTTTSTPAYADGVLYASSEAAIYALRARDGQLIWKHGISCGGPQSLLLEGGALFVGGCAVLRMSLNDGSVVWRANDMSCFDRCQIASDGTRIFVPTAAGVTAVAATDGALLWSLETGPQKHPVRHVTYANGSVFFGNAGAGSLPFDDLAYYWYRVDAATGTVQWKQDFIYLGTTAPVVVAGDVVLARASAGYDNFLVALSATNGSQIWGQAFSGVQCTRCPAPTVLGSTVWAAGERFPGRAPQVRGLPEGAVYGFDVLNGRPAGVVHPAGLLYGLGGLAFDGANLYGTYEAQTDGVGGGIWSSGVRGQ